MRLSKDVQSTYVGECSPCCVVYASEQVSVSVYMQV